jgi:hypothetical protein
MKCLWHCSRRNKWGIVVNCCLFCGSDYLRVLHVLTGFRVWSAKCKLWRTAPSCVCLERAIFQFPISPSPLTLLTQRREHRDRRSAKMSTTSLGVLRQRKWIDCNTSNFSCRQDVCGVRTIGAQNTKWYGARYSHPRVVWNCELWHMSVKDVCEGDTWDCQVDAYNRQLSSAKRVFLSRTVCSRFARGDCTDS